MSATNQENKDVRLKIRTIERRFEVLRTTMAILVSLLIILLLVFFVSDEPLNVVYNLFIGPLTSMRRFGSVIEIMIPLTFTGLAIAITFSANRFNLISESSFHIGAVVAATIGIFSTLPAPWTILLIFLVTFLIGGLLGYIPAILEEKFNASVLVNSLMLNYVVSHFANYILNNVIRDRSSSAIQSLPLAEGVNLGRLIPKTRIHWGLVIVILIVILAYYIMHKTKWGYSLKAVGENENFARYAGINVSLVTILAQFIGSAIAGLGGAVEMLGIYDHYLWTDTPGYGFDGVIIAALARNNPKYIPLAAFFLAYIRAGADVMNRSTDVPAEIVSVVQAIIIVLIASQAFLSKWKQKQIIKVSQEAELEGEA